MEVTRDPVLMVSMPGRITDLNPAAALILGGTRGRTGRLRRGAGIRRPPAGRVP